MALIRDSRFHVLHTRANQCHAAPKLTPFQDASARRYVGPAASAARPSSKWRTGSSGWTRSTSANSSVAGTAPPCRPPSGSQTRSKRHSQIWSQTFDWPPGKTIREMTQRHETDGLLDTGTRGTAGTRFPVGSYVNVTGICMLGRCWCLPRSAATASSGHKAKRVPCRPVVPLAP